MSEFQNELEALLNKYSMETASNTPDYTLVAYLVGCLGAWNEGMRLREEYYHGPGQIHEATP